jgi:hypothetical protein
MAMIAITTSNSINVKAVTADGLDLQAMPFNYPQTRPL